MSQMENKSKVFVDKLGSLVANKRSIERVELNNEYYDKACERIKLEQAQLTLFRLKKQKISRTTLIFRVICVIRC